MLKHWSDIMRKLRAAALAVMILGFAGVYAAVLSDPAENLSAAYVFGAIGICGCAIMSISGVIELAGIVKKRISAKRKV